jgi:hypothetical protein
MRRSQPLRIAFLVVVAVLGTTGVARAEPPLLVSSEPADGASDVPLDVGVLRLRFDRNMKQNAWSLLLPEEGEAVFPPLAGDDAASWTDERTFELRLGLLAPDTRYALRLNSVERQGFRSAEQDEPLAPRVVSFRTAGRRAPPLSPLLLGVWREATGARLAFAADGRVERRTPRPDGTSGLERGAWRLDGDALAIRWDGASTEERRDLRWGDEGHAALVDAAGVLAHLERESGSRPPPPTAFRDAPLDLGALLGAYDVVTKLVAASKPTNEGYRPGDLRQEVWSIARGGPGLVLTTPAGSAAGVTDGRAFVFEALRDTGLNLKIRVRVEGWLSAPGRIAGTIKAQYFGTFDNYVAMDAWSFVGGRR